MMTSKENEETVKLRYNGEKSTLNKTKWVERVRKSPTHVFDDVYEQQESDADHIKQLQAKLLVTKARISTLERDFEKAIEEAASDFRTAQLITRLVAQSTREQTCTTRINELNERVTAQDQEREEYEDRISAIKDHVSALKAQLEVQEESARIDKIQIAHLKEKLDQAEIQVKCSQASQRTAEETQQQCRTELLSNLESLRLSLSGLEAKVTTQQEQQNSQTTRISDLSDELKNQTKRQEGWHADVEDLLTDQCKWQQTAKGRIADLENSLTAQATVQDRSTLTASTTETTLASRADKELSKALPDPPKLTRGFDPNLANWKYLMELKFRENSDHFDTPGSRLAYLVSRTSGEAHNQLLTRLRSKVLYRITDVEDALEYLDMLYHEPELRTTGVHDFRHPDQPTNRFWGYFRVFVWNAVKHEHPEADWNRKLHEYLQFKFVEDIEDFSSFQQGSPKELAKEAFLRLLKLEWHDIVAKKSIKHKEFIDVESS